MALNFDTSGILSVNGTTVLNFNSSGHPNFVKPNFKVSQTTNATAIGSDILFNSITFNTGSHYNAANGRFTAPIAGIYYFSWRQLVQNADDPAAYVFGIFKNGTEWQRATTRKALDNTWNTNMLTTHVSMAANDYVTVRFIAGAVGATTYLDGFYNSFIGFLVT